MVDCLPGQVVTGQASRLSSVNIYLHMGHTSAFRDPTPFFEITSFDVDSRLTIRHTTNSAISNRFQHLHRSINAQSYPEITLLHVLHTKHSRTAAIYRQIGKLQAPQKAHQTTDIGVLVNCSGTLANRPERDMHRAIASRLQLVLK